MVQQLGRSLEIRVLPATGSTRRHTRSFCLASRDGTLADKLLPANLPFRASSGGVSSVGTVGGSDQLVDAPTNQGQNGSSFSTTRHVPRPPTPTARCNLSKSPTRIPQQITALHLSTLLGAGWFMRSNLGFVSPSRTYADFASHRVVKLVQRAVCLTRGSGCIMSAKSAGGHPERCRESYLIFRTPHTGP